MLYETQAQEINLMEGQMHTTHHTGAVGVGNIRSLPMLNKSAHKSAANKKSKVWERKTINSNLDESRDSLKEPIKWNATASQMSI